MLVYRFFESIEERDKDLNEIVTSLTKYNNTNGKYIVTNIGVY